MSGKPKRLMVMAGGTGGHVFPGLAVAHHLMAQGWQVRWLGTADRMEADLVPKHGIEIDFIRISGLRGKGPVSYTHLDVYKRQTLVGEMAKAAGWAVGVGGNIGLPALSLLRQECQLYVLELSSFQLETTYSLRAAAATILNVTEDHMDRYPFGLQQYRGAKLRVYENAAVCVVNADDALTMPCLLYTSRCV